jgi:hypothetical protein
MGRSATALSLDSDQSGVAAISIVETFVAIELPFKIVLVPKQSLIEIFAPDGPDQSLDETLSPAMLVSLTILDGLRTAE